MSASDSDALQRAEVYCNRQGIAIEKQLGAGYDGIVLSTNVGSAVKSLKYEELYQRELAVYMRLRDRDVDSVLGFAVPRLINYNDELWVIEMEIVSPPFIVDFAGGKLDTPWEYPSDVRAEWLREKREQFEDRWPQVNSLLSAFRGLGIHLSDVKPGNITFAADEDEVE